MPPADAPSPVAALRESAERAPESPSSIAATLRPLAERATAALDAAASGYLRGEPSDALNAANSQAQGRLLAACSPERVLALCEAVERYEAALTAIDDVLHDGCSPSLFDLEASACANPENIARCYGEILAIVDRVRSGYTPTPEPTDA